MTSTLIQPSCWRSSKSGNNLQGELKILFRGTQDLYNAQTTTNVGLTAEIDKYKQEAKKLSPLIEIYNELMREKKEYDDKYNILRARLSSRSVDNFWPDWVGGSASRPCFFTFNPEGAALSSA